MEHNIIRTRYCYILLDIVYYSCRLAFGSQVTLTFSTCQYSIPFSFSFSFSFLLHSICIILEALHDSSHSPAREAFLLASISVDDVVFPVLNLDAIQGSLTSYKYFAQSVSVNVTKTKAYGQNNAA